MPTLHIVYIVIMSMATGAGPLAHAFPASWLPYFSAVQASLIFVGGVLGAVTGPMVGAGALRAAAAKTLQVLMLMMACIAVGPLLALLVSACKGDPAGAVVPVADFGVCVLETYASEPPGTPIPKVIADVQGKCGGDEVQIVRLLDAHESPNLHATKAHLAQ